MARTVLITRPEPDAAPFAARVAALGHAPLIEPLLAIRFLEDVPVELAGVEALAFTSANGVRALVRRMPDAGGAALHVFAVGDATARAARDAGFARVTAAAGDVTSLARLIAAEASAGPMLHVAGRERAGDLVQLLTDAGIDARRIVLYAAEPVEAFSPGTRAALAAGGVDDVTIFSPRTARQFVTLMTKAGLAGAAARLRLVALSQNVAAAAAALPFAAVAVASSPDQVALLELLADTSGTDR